MQVGEVKLAEVKFCQKRNSDLLQSFIPKFFTVPKPKCWFAAKFRLFSCLLLSGFKCHLMQDKKKKTTRRSK